MDAAPEKLTRNELLEHLSDLLEDHDQLYAKATARPFRELRAIDHIIAAVLRRSNALIQAFLTLQKQGNELAAMPLIRLQADSVLRLYAFRKAEDPVALAEHMMANKNLSAFDNKAKLRDFDLRQELKTEYEYLNDLYEELSGYVHFSLPHLLNVFEDWQRPDIKDDDELSYGKVDELPMWRDERKRDALLQLVGVTNYLLKEIAALQASQS
jgi:hypothetical protein